MILNDGGEDDQIDDRCGKYNDSTRLALHCIRDDSHQQLRSGGVDTYVYTDMHHDTDKQQEDVPVMQQGKGFPEG